VCDAFSCTRKKKSLGTKKVTLKTDAAAVVCAPGNAVMFDGETTTFRFGFGDAETGSETAAGKGTTAAFGADVATENGFAGNCAPAEEIDGDSVRTADDVTWNGTYLTFGSIEIVRGDYGSTAGTLEGCPEESDLVPRVYEGGLKVWECANDLAALIAERGLGSDVDVMEDVHVLELGAGHAVPGLVAARKFAGRCRALTLTDYNRDVVEEVTVPNAQTTLLLMENEGERVPEKVRYLSGDWSGYSAFVDAGDVDVLLTSESIYDVSQYQSLCTFISHALSARGVCYVAAKSYYFGVGGGTSAFTTFCEKFFDLAVDKVETVSDGKSNVREILLVRKKQKTTY
jgi:hypothetical protein